jgi:hypothetical protein
VAGVVSCQVRWIPCVKVGKKNRGAAKACWKLYIYMLWVKVKGRLR